MGKRVLILGGGFGGVAAAVRLRDLLAPDDEITIVDRQTDFMMGFRKSLTLVGGSWDAYRRPLKALEKRGINVVHETITSIDPASRSVEAGGRLSGDAMLVALGAEVVPDAVPGLREHGFSAYSAADVPRAAEALAGMKEGRVVVAVFGLPYKCSPAPFELAILVDDAARKRRQNLMIGVVTPAPRSIPVLGAQGCAVVEGFLFGRGIQFRANAKAASVEKGRLLLEDGEEIPFELLLGVPPHRVPAPVSEAGLTGPTGWVKANPRTLEVPGHEGVWAVGDVVGFKMANDQPFPKAGVFAANEGVVAAERIAAYLSGRDATATFDGTGGCWLEVGDGRAVAVRGNFLASPAPEVELTEPSAEMLQEKERYEVETLDAWFGPAA